MKICNEWPFHGPLPQDSHTRDKRWPFPRLEGPFQGARAPDRGREHLAGAVTGFASPVSPRAPKSSLFGTALPGVLGVANLVL